MLASGIPDNHHDDSFCDYHNDLDNDGDDGHDNGRHKRHDQDDNDHGSDDHISLPT